MSDDQQMIRNFLHEAKTKADHVLNSDHIGADVKSVIKDLMQIFEQFQTMTQQSSGQSADTRILKKKFEQSKADTKAAENKAEKLKKLLLSLIEEVKVVASEANLVLKRHTDAGDPDTSSANRIKLSAQKMIEKIVAG